MRIPWQYGVLGCNTALAFMEKTQRGIMQGALQQAEGPSTSQPRAERACERGPGF
jgi:hypothetical protein